MLRIELTDDQARALREVLSQQVSELGMEIAGTERMAFRDQLKLRRRRLNEVLDAIGRVESQAAA